MKNILFGNPKKRTIQLYDAVYFEFEGSLRRKCGTFLHGHRIKPNLASLCQIYCCTSHLNLVYTVQVVTKLFKFLLRGWGRFSYPGCSFSIKSVQRVYMYNLYETEKCSGRKPVPRDPRQIPSSHKESD